MNLLNNIFDTLYFVSSPDVTEWVFYQQNPRPVYDSVLKYVGDTLQDAPSPEIAFQG